MRNKAAWAAGVLGVLGFTTACGGTASNHDDAAAGSSGANAAGAANAGDTSNAAGAGAANGDAGNGQAGEALQCTRTTECKATCSAKVGACLAPREGALIDSLSEGSMSSLALEATVAAVTRDAWPEGGVIGCFGEHTEQRIHVSLLAADGKEFDLSVSPEQIDEQRFAVGEKLALDYRLYQPRLFAREQRLIIRAGANTAVDQPMAAFFIHSLGTFPRGVIDDYTTADGVSEADDSGLGFDVGDLTCPWSVPNGNGCSTAKFATLVKAGTESVADPCEQGVGDFKVTASYQAAGQAPSECKPVTGFCDASSTFVAAGVRVK